MTKEQLIELKKWLSKMTPEERKQHDLVLRGLANGEIQGPPVGYPSIDKPWLQYYSEDVLKKDIPIMSSYDFVYEKNKMDLDKNSINYYNNILSFKEFFNNIEIVEKALIEFGVKRGEIVTISLPNMPESAYLFYACSKIGAVANMIDPRTSKEGIEKYLNEANSKLFIVIDVLNDKIKDIKNTTNVKDVITVSPAESLPPVLKTLFKLKNINKKSDNRFIKWSDFYETGVRSKIKSSSEEYTPNEPVLIVHTGGTTGTPKGVVLSNENINAMVHQSMLFPTDLRPEHKWLDIMPPFIAYGIGSGLHFPLSLRMETILIPQFKPEEFDKLILKYKPNHIAGVPAHWDYIINSKRLKNKDLSFLITCAVGGDKMDEKLEVKATDFLKEHGSGYGIAKGYGMTEVNGSIGRTTNENNEVGSVGIPFYKSSVGIFEIDSENELGYDEIGEICMAGPNTMLGYYNDEEETDKIMRKHSDGQVWIHSGDLGYMKSDGNLFVVDRIKNMIIRHDGFKVFPHFIEQCIEKHPAVKQCKVVGVSDKEHIQGKLPVAFIVPQENTLIDNKQMIEEIKAICERELPEYSQPIDFHFKEKLPLTPIGKIDTMSLENELETNKVKKLIKKQ